MMKDFMDLMIDDVVDMPMVEVLAEGHYADANGKKVKFNEADIDQIISNYEILKEHGVKPPVKLGHTQKQILNQSDGQPSLGWLSGVKRLGKKMGASITQMPMLIKKGIDNGRYKRVSLDLNSVRSISGLPSHLYDSVKGYVITGLALLGADPPAIKTLADLSFSEDNEGTIHISRNWAVLSEQQEQKDMDEKLKEMQAAHDALMVKFEALQAENNNLKSAVALSETSLGELRTLQVRLSEQNVTIESLKKDKEDRDFKDGLMARVDKGQISLSEKQTWEQSTFPKAMILEHIDKSFPEGRVKLEPAGINPTKSPSVLDLQEAELRRLSEENAKLPKDQQKTAGELYLQLAEQKPDLVVTVPLFVNH